MNHLSEEQLNEYLDHESQERELIELHLSICDECATRFNFLQALFIELDSLPEIELSRDLAMPFVQRVGQSVVLPKWLTLTLVLQAIFAVITAAIATPLVIELTSQTLPILQMPSFSFTEALIHLQAQWTIWLDRLSTFKIPVMPSLPTMEMPSLVIMFTLAAVSMVWLVGNSLLLRNQIK